MLDVVLVIQKMTTFNRL